MRNDFRSKVPFKKYMGTYITDYNDLTRLSK